MPEPAVDDRLLGELRGVALEVAGRAAELVRDRRLGDVEVAATKSSAVDVVTEADRASEALVTELLAELRPDDALLGEEGASAPGSSGVRWVVDPIDGTVNFLYGIPQYAVSLAAEVDGEAVVGVVVNAATGTVYEAALGQGALRDGRPLAVRDPAPLAERLVLTGFSYDAGLRELQAASLVRLLPRIRDVRRRGSAALDLCHVAEGTADGYVEEGVNLWDHAAGGLVAREAGARTELTTGQGGLDLLLCAPAHGFEELRAAVVEAGFLG
ncbi:inositol monophosphatase family protein [Nocardioides perillae]|uniref:Inositol-1-monophosphatase n=1 Tax=Nocardioides perillae TaxID=1119534 RepID=A0A7Y9RW75_9ACTN|nr:inositol monophosphatase family protein [Nocardioides perillae]NYG55688.1 myo-inositol-1(or 4)-monophosphatase [Nocardioides perillae]